MTEQRKGIRLKLSPARKMVMELVHHARKVPSIPVARTFDVAAVAEARRRAISPPSWTAIFLRGYALVAEQCPELRRAFIPWPYPHLYEHPSSVCALIVERQWQGEKVLLGTKIRAPEKASLEGIDGHLHWCKKGPVLEIGHYRQTLRIGRLPWLLRRFTFWHSLYLSGSIRAKRFGTFMVSSYGSLGAESLHPLSFLTTLLTFGPIRSNGEVVVKVVYDHRVMDGACVARCLGDLERVLNTEIVEELRDLHPAGGGIHPRKKSGESHGYGSKAPSEPLPTRKKEG